MDFGLTAEQQSFRQDVRSFLLQEIPAEWHSTEWPGAFGAGLGEEEDLFHMIREFHRKLSARGWLALWWPKKYGGQGRSPLDQLVLSEELGYHRAPPMLGATTFIGPAIMFHGTEEQKEEWLPRIARGELVFCEGLSEPNSGSDLASLQTRAVEDADGYVIEGQKCWTTMAHRFDLCWLAARTDQQAAKHKGLSIFLVDMKSPGINLRPVFNIVDVHSFNDVFFDRVKVPAKRLIGEKNRGWEQITTGLNFERYTVSPYGAMKRILDDLVEWQQENWPNTDANSRSLVRSRLAQLAIEIEVGRVFSYRVAWMLDNGANPDSEAALSKLYGSELSQRLAGTATRVLGPYGQLTSKSKWAAFSGDVARGYLNSVSATIGAGTSEIQRNLIAMMKLDLPK